MKRATIVVLVLLTAGGIYGYVKYNGRTKAADESAETERVLTAEIGTIDLKVNTTGKITANLDVEIKSKASGQIVHLPFDVSDVVTTDTLLCELDPIDEERNVTLRNAALTSAEARLRQAMEELDSQTLLVDTQTSAAQAEYNSASIRFADVTARLQRTQELFEKQLVSKEAYDAVLTEYANAENSMRRAEISLVETQNLPRNLEKRRQDVRLSEVEVERARIELENAEQRLMETQIFSPMEGVITQRPVQTGQIIASGISNVGGGTTLMVVSDLSRLFVNANVDESDIGKIRVGQRTIITADSFPGRRFRGRVERIASKGTTNQNVVTFEVKIELEGRERSLLRPEMTANVEIQADSKSDILVVPNEAVQFGRGGYFMTLKDDSTTEGRRVEVVTGITDGINTEIVRGIEPGDEIILPRNIQSRWARGDDQNRQFQRGMRAATATFGGGSMRGGGGRR